MKIFKTYISILCFLLFLGASSAFGFSTHNTRISISFDRELAGVYEPITVTVGLANLETDDLRGFYYADQIPAGLTVNTVSVKIDGSATSYYEYESGANGDIYSGTIPSRWILETPPGFFENNHIPGISFIPDLRLPKYSFVEIIYTATSSQPRTFDFDEFSWVGYYETAAVGQQAAFGHSEDTNKQFITFY